MAKTPISTAPLSFMEIVMRADAETIKAAYEARVKVDGLLAEREAAYRRIAELENLRCPSRALRPRRSPPRSQRRPSPQPQTRRRELPLLQPTRTTNNRFSMTVQ